MESGGKRTENEQRRFQGLCQLTGGAAAKKGGGKQHRSRKREIGLSTKEEGVGGSSSDRAHLQLSQIISAREVRGGEMSKYLNKFHRSLLRVGRCGERGIVGANGVERG